MTASAGRSRGLFISYRRQDAAFPAGWLYEQLAGHFGHRRVFKDVDSIQPGEDFLGVITEMVSSSDAVLVVIGPTWLVNTDGRSGRRIDATDDVVRIEIEIALWHGITIIPVLVLGAAMPKPSDLPPSIAALSRRNAIEITPNHFARDVRRLIGRLEQLGQAAPGPAPAADGPTVGDGAPQPASDLIMTAYRLQIADIAPEVLRGRDAELGQLAGYCRGTESYAWWQGEAWAGKTALLAWFALNPPTGVQVVSFFVDAGLAGQSDSEAFLEALAEQLTVLAHRSLGAPATTPARRGRLLELLSAATVRCVRDGKRLLLVVDGLDEDTGPGTGKPSIASLFPRRPPPGLHVLVTSRTGRELPVDVPADHPLRTCTPHQIAASAEALDHERFAQRELAGQLGSSVLCEELLGLIAASGGGLTRDDLAELTCESPHAIETLLRGRFGRSVRSRTRRLAGAAATSGRGYLFAHDTLRRAAEEQLGARLPGYRNQLHDWADRYRTRGWHTDTPRYLLHDYPRMLALVGDVDRLSTLACDRARHEHMRELTGGDALALDEIALAQTAGLDRHPPDLRIATALALRREELGRRNAIVPVSLPAVWAALGNTGRAQSLARSAMGRGRQGEALMAAALAAAAAGHLSDAEALAGLIDDQDRRDRAVAAVAVAAVPVDLPRAERLAAQIRTPSLQKAVASRIAVTRAVQDPRLAEELLAPGRTDCRDLTEHAIALAAAGEHARAEKLAVTNAAGARRGAEARCRIAAALAQAGAVGAAERVAATIRAPVIRARAIADAVVAAAVANDTDAADRLTTELRDCVLRAPNPDAACDVVLPLAAMLIRRQLPERAKHIARLAEELLERVEGRHAWVAQRRAIARAAAGDRSGTAAALSQIANPHHLARATREVALLTESAGDHAYTETLIAALVDPRSRAEALTSVARADAERGEAARAAELAAQVEKITSCVGLRSRLAAAADHLVDGLLAARCTNDAASVAQCIPEPDRRESAIGRVATTLATEGRFNSARALADRLHPRRRAWVLTAVAEQLANADAITDAAATADSALAIMDNIPDAVSRTTLLIRLARLLPPVGRIDDAEKLLTHASHHAETITDPDWHVRALALLAIDAAQRGRHDESARLRRHVNDVLSTLPDGPARCRAHARLAECFAEAGDLITAEEHLHQVRSTVPRVRAGCALASTPRTNAARASELLDETAHLIPAISRPEDRSRSLARLAAAGTAFTHNTGLPAHPAWTLRPVAELLADQWWSAATPALAHLDPAAFAELRAWVVDHLDPALQGLRHIQSRGILPSEPQSLPASSRENTHLRGKVTSADDSER